MQLNRKWAGFRVAQKSRGPHEKKKQSPSEVEQKHTLLNYETQNNSNNKRQHKDGYPQFNHSPGMHKDDNRQTERCKDDRKELPQILIQLTIYKRDASIEKSFAN